MNKKTKKLTLILIVVLVILAFFLTPKLLDSLPKHFSISSDANFYIVGYHNIEGYKLDDSEFKKVSDEKISSMNFALRVENHTESLEELHLLILK